MEIFHNEWGKNNTANLIWGTKSCDTKVVQTVLTIALLVYFKILFLMGKEAKRGHKSFT